MQGGRGSGDPFFGFGDPFAGFGGNIMRSMFEGRDPFDDPFFSRPFEGMFQSSILGSMGNPFMDTHAFGPRLSRPRGSHFMNGHAFGPSPFGSIGSPFMDAHAFGSGIFGAGSAHADASVIDSQPAQTNRSRGPIIEELDSDDEKEEAEGKEKKENPRKHGRSDREPYVEHPDDEAEGRRTKYIHHGNELSIMNNRQLQVPRTQGHSFTFQSSTVTYGGANGAYYTSSTTKRTGSDGLTFEEHKEADSMTRQASHRLSRGIHDKGHTVTRKLNADGRVDSMQMLHNINEDELAGFNEAWEGKAQKHVPSWTGGFNVHGGSVGDSQNRLPSNIGRALPSTGHEHVQNVRPNMGNYAGSSQPQNTRYRGETSNARGSGAANTSKMGGRKRH